MNRQEFTEKAKHNIDKVSERIDVLELKTKTASAEMKLKYHEQINDLKEKKSALESKYHEVMDMAEDKWDDAKESVKTGMESLKDTMKHLFD